MIEIKIEHNKVKAREGAEPTSIGLMVEATAPTAPERTQEIVRKDKAIVFVVDRSGSMGGGRLELVKGTILDILGRLNPADYISLVTFDDVAITDVPLVRIGDTDVAQLRRLVSNLQPGGSTNLEQGYRYGLAEAASAPEGIEATVILLSDGQANSGNQDPESLGQLAAAATEHFITTTTIGIGEGYDERILDAVAGAGAGNHVAAIRIDEAVDALNAEIEDMLQKTVSGLRVEIELDREAAGQAARVRKAGWVRKFHWDAPLAVVELGDLSTAEEKNWVFDVTLALRDPEIELREVDGIVVRWQYTDLTSGDFVTGEKRIALELVDKENWVEPARDEDIVAELKALRLADVRQQAQQLYDMGNYEQADALLTAAGLELDEWARGANLSARQQARIFRHTSEMTSFAMMDDNVKSKRMRETSNRVMRDKINFRDKSGDKDQGI